jgi:hypothetical protein
VTGGSGSNTMTYAGVQPNGRHRINFGSSTALQSIRLGFYQKQIVMLELQVLQLEIAYFFMKEQVVSI